MAAKASLEQFDVILTAGPKGLDIEDEKLLNTLRSPKRTLEPESVGFPFVSHHNFSVPWETEGEILHHFVLGSFFCRVVNHQKISIRKHGKGGERWRTFRSLYDQRKLQDQKIYTVACVHQKTPATTKVHLDTSNQHWCNYDVMTLEHKVAFRSITPSCVLGSKVPLFPCGRWWSSTLLRWGLHAHYKVSRH